MNITISSLKHITGYIVALSTLRPGVVNVTIETPEILPYGEYEASYKTASEEITGALKVSKYGAYQNRWRASGIFTRRWKRRRGIILE
jgi:hypothetical protein